MNDQWGYRTRRRGKHVGGGELSRSAGYNLFSNIFYTGRMLIRGKVVPGAHEAVITLQEFHEIQGIIGRGGYKKHTFLFNGTIRCEDCGRAVVGELQRGRSGRGVYVYYRCGNGKCGGTRKSVKEEQIRAQVDERLRRVTWPAWVRDVLLDEAKAYFRQEIGDFDTITAHEQRALNNAVQRRSNLLDAKLDGDIDQATFRQKNDELTAEIDRLSSCITTTKEKLDRAWTTVNRVCDFITLGFQTYQNGTDEQRRQILANLGAKFSYKNGVIAIHTNPLLPENLGGLQTPEGGYSKEKTGGFAPALSPGWAVGTFLQTFHLAIKGLTMPELDYVK